MEAPCLLYRPFTIFYDNSAQGIGSQEVWPRYRSVWTYRVAPATQTSRFGLGALARVLLPEAFIGLSYLLPRLTP